MNGCFHRLNVDDPQEAGGGHRLVRTMQVMTMQIGLNLDGGACWDDCRMVEQTTLMHSIG
ncbi:MAG: hypothetical protein ACKO23_06695 [Gemmataceae bacterium]